MGRQKKSSASDRTCLAENNAGSLVYIPFPSVPPTYFQGEVCRDSIRCNNSSTKSSQAANRSDLALWPCTKGFPAQFLYPLSFICNCYQNPVTLHGIVLVFQIQQQHYILGTQFDRLSHNRACTKITD